MHRPHPDYIQFFPTLRCDQQCSFCFNRGIAAAEEITPGNFGKLASKISAIGIQELDILGGEPTLHPCLSDIIGIAGQNGLKTSLSTNGSNINVLKRLSDKHVPNLLTIGISINGKKTTDGLHNYIIAYKPLLKSICTQKSFISESATHYLALPDINYYLLFMDTPFNDDLKESLPFYEFHKKLKEAQTEHKKLQGVFCSGFVPDIERHPILELVRCPAGTTKLSVMPDGSAYPCYLFFRHEEFKLGNMLEDDFKDIWENPILNFFRRFDKNNCPKVDCELHPRCHGGCPAISLLIYGSLDAPDPRCV